MQDLAVKADNSLRGLSKQKIKVDSGLREKGYSNLSSYAYDLIDKYLTSPKNKPTIQQLKEIFEKCYNTSIDPADDLLAPETVGFGGGGSGGGREAAEQEEVV